MAAAKQLVSGDVGIDMVAGPSEVCVPSFSISFTQSSRKDFMASIQRALSSFDRV